MNIPTIGVSIIVLVVFGFLFRYINSHDTEIREGDDMVLRYSNPIKYFGFFFLGISIISFVYYFITNNPTKGGLLGISGMFFLFSAPLLLEAYTRKIVLTNTTISMKAWGRTKSMEVKDVESIVLYTRTGVCKIRSVSRRKMEIPSMLSGVPGFISRLEKLTNIKAETRQ